MRRRVFSAVFSGIVLSVLVFSGTSALACAACFGKSDSPLAQGMNMGILSLLVVVGLVLASVAGFFIFLARRGAAMAAQTRAESITPLQHD